MSEKCDCGCCEGTQPLTPQEISNRPGLDNLAYRVGTHGSFLETMKARLSSLTFEVETGEFGEDRNPESVTVQPLRGLTTRTSDDPAIALLDGWATVADVLSFYQERIANEGYLRTATERRSVLELARLVGYKLRPGVAASAYLAYTLENGYEVEIPAGSKVQSVPAPGQKPQIFETSEPLQAHTAFNTLKPRTTRPQRLDQNLRPANPDKPDGPLKDNRIYLKGISTNLKPGDKLLVQFQANETPKLYRVQEVKPDPANSRTLVKVQAWDFVPEPAVPVAIPAFTSRATTRRRARAASAPRVEATTISTRGNGASVATGGLNSFLGRLEAPVSLQPANSLALNRTVAQAFAARTDTITHLLTTLRPELGTTLYKALENAPVTAAPAYKVYALRTTASVFGHNAPLQSPVLDRQGNVTIPAREWEIKVTGTTRINLNITVTQTFPPPVINLREGSSAPTAAGDNPTQTTTIQIEGQATLTDSDHQLSFTTTSFNLTYPPTGETVSVRVEFKSTGESVITFGLRGTQVVVTVRNNQATVTPGSLKATFNTKSNADSSTTNTITLSGALDVASTGYTEDNDVVWLDAPYQGILPGSWVALERPTELVTGQGRVIISQAKDVSERSRNVYGISAKSTRIQLFTDWLNRDTDPFKVIRETAVFTQSEELELAEAPLDPVREAICGRNIDLDGIYSGLEAGRWLVISGERTDIKPAAPTKLATDPATQATEVGRDKIIQRGDTAQTEAEEKPLPGVPGIELVMIAGVKQTFDPTLPGDKNHTVITLANNLAYCYKLDTVTIYGNVVKATHGETRDEILGSGDGSQALQKFDLRQFPLTYVASSADPSGVESTLQVFVNDVRWHESESLAWLGPTDRNYITNTNDDDKTSVTFGNGIKGARLPTGVENVRSIYRNGIGKPGNLKAGQLSLLASRPLGVKSVTNPLPASGGADREDRDQARRNAPIAVQALDRLVSVKDYEDFARTFAGIGKASAARVSNLIYLTIAGVDDIPIDETSDLYRSLKRALGGFGDPYQAVQVKRRELLLLVISAKVKILPDYLWEKVAPKIRAALLDKFSFARRELGQDATTSEAISAIQAIPGVAYVDLDTFDGVDEEVILKHLDEGNSTAGTQGPGAGGGTTGGGDRGSSGNPASLTGLAGTLGLKNRVVANLAGFAPLYHLVQSGETLASIAARYGLALNELKALNPDLNDPLAPDTEVRLRAELLLKPAQLAILSPEVAATLILTELK